MSTDPNQIENKYAENENTTIHKRNDRLDFGLRFKCALWTAPSILDIEVASF